MATVAQKLVFFYEAVGGTSCVGWTETFYTPAVGFDKAIQQAKFYMKSRHSLLGNGAMAVAVRVSNVPNTRQTQIYFFEGKEGVPDIFTSPPGDDFDPVQVALVVRLEDAAGDKRVFWLDGLPDSVTHTLVAQGVDGTFVNSPVFKQVLDNVITLGWEMQVVNKPVTDPKTFTYPPIVKAKAVMVRNRKRGRPFFLYRGRRVA